MDDRWVTHSVRYMQDSQVYLSLSDDIFSSKIGPDGSVRESGGLLYAQYNVGLVLLGFATELALKSVVAADGIEPADSHEMRGVRQRVPRPLRRRIDAYVAKKHISARNGLRLSERGLTVQQLYDWVDDEICYEKRRYWNVSPRGSKFSSVEFARIYAGDADDPGKVTAYDVFLLADSLLHLTRETLASSQPEVSEEMTIIWETDDLASGFSEPPAITFSPPSSSP